MEAINRQLKKGALDILILNLLARGPCYGYELMGVLSERSAGYFAMKEGTLYPVLYRLEDAGCIQSAWENDPKRRGAPRKYYAITPEGERRLVSGRTELARFIRAIQSTMEE